MRFIVVLVKSSATKPIIQFLLAQKMATLTPIILPFQTYGTTSMGAFTVGFPGVDRKSRLQGVRVKCSPGTLTITNPPGSNDSVAQNVTNPPGSESVVQNITNPPVSNLGSVQELREQFIELLGKNRTPVTLKVETKVVKPSHSCEVTCDVALGSRCVSPIYPLTSKIPANLKASIQNLKDDQLVEEHLYLHTELNTKGSKQGILPVVIMKTKEICKSKRPAVVFVHLTEFCKSYWRPLLKAYAARGYIAISIDSRYHGDRATSDQPEYDDALLSAYTKGDCMPFIYDTTWDLIKLADYLTQQRDDIDPTRIGITGASLGGMHAWFTAFADTRYSVVVPLIGVQGFQWAIDNDQWQARVDSVKPPFEAARIEMGKAEIDKEVVAKVWDKINPGIRSDFDSPNTIPAIAPRPLLILNGGDDPRNPIPGLDVPRANAEKAYAEAGCPEKFQFIAEPGVPHMVTEAMIQHTSDWFDRFLFRS